MVLPYKTWTTFPKSTFEVLSFFLIVLHFYHCSLVDLELEPEDSPRRHRKKRSILHALPEYNDLLSAYPRYHQVWYLVWIQAFNYCCGQLWVWHMFCGQDLWWAIPLHIFHWSCWDRPYPPWHWSLVCHHPITLRWLPQLCNNKNWHDNCFMVFDTSFSIHYTKIFAAVLLILFAICLNSKGQGALWLYLIWQVPKLPLP